MITIKTETETYTAIMDALEIVSKLYKDHGMTEQHERFEKVKVEIDITKENAEINHERLGGNENSIS